MMANLIAAGIIKEFESAAGTLRILDGIELSMTSGQSMAVLGPSGSGKSTLLHILGTLEKPTSGTVQLDEVNPFTLAPGLLSKFRNEKIGFVFQEHFLLPQLTALENVLMPVLAVRHINEADVDHAKQLLGNVGLDGRLDHTPAELSGGERQRVAIARALVRQPQLLLADEPTGNLDQVSAKVVGELLVNVQRQSQAILICVTHSEALASCFQKIGRLDEGSLALDT